MTVSSTTNRVSYTGNGATTAFAFPFYFQSTADLVVVETVIATGIQTTKALTTDYTISGATDSSGFYPNGGTVNAVAAPASTVTWTILRDPAATQTTQFVDNDPLPAASLNGVADKVTTLVQRGRDLILRSLHQPDGDSATIGALPSKVARAGTGAGSYFGFDANGDPTVFTIANGGTSVPISVAMTPVVEASTLALAKTAFGLAYADLIGTLRNYLAGLTLSNDATNTKLDVAAGMCADDTNTALLTLASGVIDATTVGANGLDTGSLAANTTYHIFAIAKAAGATPALLASGSVTPTLPATYTLKRRIGSIYTDASSHFVLFNQVGNHFRLKSPAKDVDATSSGAAAVTRVLASVPNGIIVRPDLQLQIVSGATANAALLVTSLTESASTPSVPQCSILVPGSTANGPSSSLTSVYTNTSAQVRTQESNTDSRITIYTNGWFDTRGQ